MKIAIFTAVITAIPVVMAVTPTTGFITATRPAQLAVRETINPLGGAISGALAPTPAPPSAKVVDPPPPLITISLIKHAGVDLPTKQNKTSDPVTAPVGGVPPDGVLHNGDTGLLVAPTGWEGAIFINNAQHGMFSDRESLVEGSFAVQQNVADFALLDIDVSFVNGFSYPIVCRCEGDNKFLSGCDQPLWAISQCPPLGTTMGSGVVSTAHESWNFHAGGGRGDAVFQAVRRTRLHLSQRSAGRQQWRVPDGGTSDARCCPTARIDGGQAKLVRVLMGKGVW